ncbi:MAG: VPLPA-CTERM sorting domain-containing protein [Pseudomonadota bacterium]
MARFLFTPCVAFLALTLVPPAAQASLIGDTVFCVADMTTAADCDNSAVIGAGSEFDITQGDPETIAVDFFADSVRFFVEEDINLNGGTVTFSDLNWVDNPAGQLVGIANFTSSGGVNVTAADIMTMSNGFTVTFPNDVILIDSFFEFDLVTTDAVPLPPAMLLMMAGLAGFALVARRLG